MSFADIPDTLRNLLEPGDSGVIVKDDSLARPFEWAPNTLYVFPSGIDEHRIVGASPQDEEHFSVTAAFCLDRKDETGHFEQRRDISLGLIDKAHAYAAVVRNNRNGTFAGGTLPWDDLRAAINWDYLARFDARGFALVCTGYRFLG